MTSFTEEQREELRKLSNEIRDVRDAEPMTNAKLKYDLSVIISRLQKIKQEI